VSKTFSLQRDQNIITNEIAVSGGGTPDATVVHHRIPLNILGHVSHHGDSNTVICHEPRNSGIRLFDKQLVALQVKSPEIQIL
jgi:hypothetical protein